jgi:DNA-binding LytR/AlgR family response regulator
MTAPSDPAAVSPITWASARRTLVVAACVGLFMGFVGAFGTGNLPFLIRAAFMIGLSWTGAVLGLASFRIVNWMGWARRRRMVQAALSGLLMTVPLGVAVWAATRAVTPGNITLGALPGFISTTFVMAEAMTLFVVFLGQRRAPHPETAPVAPPAAPRFLDRLPAKLQGADLWAVEAQDHYLRLHTSLGQDLILLRLADAIDELEGLEGAQVHRSWWVARDAIAEASRGDGRATLVLRDGSEVPVSRTYARILREKAWI